MRRSPAVALLFLFTSWIPFALLLPAARRERKLRIAWLPVVVGLLASVYAAVTFLAWPRASIRLDLLLVLAGLFAADAAAAIAVARALFGKRPEPALSPPARGFARGAALTAIAWLAVAAMGFAWSRVSAARSTAGYFHGQELLLAAKLRDRESAAIAYGPLSTADAALAPWVGVWDLASSTGRVTTLVLAADRRVWLRFDCTPGSCEAGPGTLELAGADRASAQVPGSGGRIWGLELRKLPAGELEVSIAPSAGSAGPLVATARPRALPAAAAPPPGDLEPLGIFSVLEWLPQHVALTELRLWRQGRKIYGIALCHIALPARPTMFSPRRFESVESDDGSFAVDVERYGGTARLAAGALELTGRDPNNWQKRRTVTLLPAAQLRDPRLDLIPGHDLARWREWARDVVPPIVDWTAPERPEVREPPG